MVWLLLVHFCTFLTSQVGVVHHEHDIKMLVVGRFGMFIPAPYDMEQCKKIIRLFRAWCEDGAVLSVLDKKEETFPHAYD